MDLRASTPTEINILEIIEPAIADHGLELVQIRMMGRAEAPQLQIMVENPKTGSVLVDKCGELSTELSALLDVEDPITTKYTLEVTSPGIDRPLTRMKDFALFSGHEVKIELSLPRDNGQKRFQGVYNMTSDDVMTLAHEHGEDQIALDHIAKAQLVFTEELMDFARERALGAKDNETPAEAGVS